MRKLGKATMAAVLSTAMVMGNVGGNIPLGWNMQQVKAEDISYVELNEDFESTGEVYFKLPACGSVSFQDEEGKNVSATINHVSDDGNLTSVAYTYCGAVRLWAGTYKVGDSYKQISKVVFTEESGEAYEQEENDTIDTANEIKTNSVYIGNLNCYSTFYGEESTSDEDYYKVTLENPGKIYVQYTVEDFLTGYIGDYGRNENTVTLYAEDEDGNISEITRVVGQYSENKTRYSRRYRLPKGIYYVSVSGGYQSGNYTYADITDYQLKVNYTEESADKYEQEYNDTLETANKISTNSDYTGNISEEKDVDYFTFTLDKKSNVKLKTKVPRQSTDKLFTFGIYKSNGTSKVAEVKSGTNPTAYTTEKELEPGTYYVIVKKGDATNVESAVDYSINVMAIEAQEIVATPAPTQEPEDVDTDDEQTGEDTEATAAPGAVATRQPIVDDDEETDESEPGAVATRAPVATAAPDDDEDEDGSDDEEEFVTTAPVITKTPTQEDDKEETVVTDPTKKPATAEPVTTTPVTKDPVVPEPTTNAPATDSSATTAPTKESANPTVTATAKPTEAPDLIDELRMYADVDEDEELRVGDQFNVYAEAVPDEMNNDLEVIWKSSNNKIATVSEEGEVTCKGAGTVSISASTTDGSKITVSMKFTIKRALSRVNTLSKITYTQGKLTPNFTKAKTAYTLTLGKNMSSTTIRYKKSDSASTVKINGSSASKLKVRLKPGESKTVKITVKAENGNSKTYKIKVRRKR